MASLLSAVSDARAEAAPRRRARNTKAARPVKLGFIALTDCASLVIAKELGYFEDRDLDVTLEKQASWPATRDNLLTNQIDGAHALFSLPFSVATGIGGKATTTARRSPSTTTSPQRATGTCARSRRSSRPRRRRWR